MKNIILGIAAVAAIIVAWFFFFQQPASAPTPASQTSTDQAMTIEDYVRQNISVLSPEKEVLGGTFYVTNIEAHGGAGTVSYEDGHVAYTADFTYSIDAQGRPSVQSFIVRPAR